METIVVKQSPAMAVIQTRNCGKANTKQMIGNSNV